MGIEPTRPAWEAGVLPLNYTRMIFIILVGYLDFVKMFSESLMGKWNISPAPLQILLRTF